MEKPFSLPRMTHRVLSQHKGKTDHFLFFLKKYHFLILFKRKTREEHIGLLLVIFCFIFPLQIYQATKILPGHKSICNNMSTEVLCESQSSRSASLAPPLMHRSKHPYGDVPYGYLPTAPGISSAGA